MKLVLRLLQLIVPLVFFSSCAFRLINRDKNIIYNADNKLYVKSEESLNVFYPQRKKELKPVLVYIHGGNWNAGKKSLYNYFGSRLARKNIVAVTIDYPLSPSANYKEMALASAQSIKWMKENIQKYGGDSSRIFISGHSAGGHLATLISLDNTYFNLLKIKNPVKGIVMIDAAGLDMFGYLKDEKPGVGHTYLKTFSADTSRWKDATPLYHLSNSMPPMLIFRGGKTYPSISKSNEKFVNALMERGANYTYKIQKGKHHIPMITQFFNPYNRRYRDIKNFMNPVK